jgi:hypothetical protein
VRGKGAFSYRAAIEIPLGCSILETSPPFGLFLFPLPYPPTFLYPVNTMRSLNPRWLSVVLGGAFGGAAAWYACSILASGKFEDRHRGHHHIFTPQNEPAWYWAWFGIWAGIALFCLFQAIRALAEIIQVYQMDKQIEERERLSGLEDQIEKSVSIKIVGEDGVAREYDSLDDVPAEFRAEIEALEKEPNKTKGDPPVTKVSRTDNTITSETVTRREATVYKIMDESGTERVYRSLDEMPPELRLAIEEAEKQSPPKGRG